MKKMKSFGMLMILVTIVFTACNNADENSGNTIEGTYTGILTNKSATGTIIGNSNATADISKTGNGLIEVHCYGNAVDTTFMLNYYENHDSIMVCMTGNAFNQTYGHMLGQGHMMGGMMGDKQNGETDWMHHLSDEHVSGDVHFGGFDMNTNNFSYTFKMADGYMYFNGNKK